MEPRLLTKIIISMDLVGLVLVIDAVHALLAAGDQLPHGVHGIVGLTLNHAEIKF